MKMLGFSLRRSLLVGLTLSCSVFLPAARADLLYDVTTVTGIVNASFEVAFVPFEFTFTEPTFLTSTTVIPEADLTVVTSPGCTITSATIFNPSSAIPEVGETMTAPCGVAQVTGGFTVPWDQLGSYSNGAPLPTVLTISGTAVPEPSSTGLLLIGMAAVALFGKRNLLRLRSTR